MLVMTGLYLAALIAVIYFSRARVRRVEGALVGGLAAALFGIGAMLGFEVIGMWRIPFEPNTYFLPVLYFGLAISLAPIYLVTWRLTRRFGWKGLGSFIAAAAVIGPPRDYWYAETFPEWMVFARGILPVLADSVSYVGLVIVGHAVMTLVAGPASDDQLTR